MILLPPARGPVLGIETSGTKTAVALADEIRLLAETSELGTAHNEVLFRLITDVLAEAEVRASSLSGIGVTVGPGMFTSLRVGIATAKALALVQNVPVAGIDTFLALAASVGSSDAPILAVVDARKQQVYAALLVKTELALGPLLATPAELAARILETVTRSQQILVSGSGSDLCLPELNRAGVPATDSDVRFPSSTAVCRLARARIAAGRTDDIRKLEPLYLRRTDAELVREQRASS